MRTFGVVAVVAPLVALGGLFAAPSAAAVPSDTVTVDVGRFPYGVAVDPGTHTAYVINMGNGQAHDGNGSLSTITAAGVQTRRVGGTPVAVGVDTTTHTVYVAVGNTQSRLMISSPTGTHYLDIDDPIALAVDSTNHTVWLLEAPRMLVRIVGRTQTVYPLTSTFPDYLAVDTHNHIPYVLSADGVLSSVENGAVVDRSTGGGASALAVDDRDDTVYVAHSDYFADHVLHSARLTELRGLYESVADLGFYEVGGLAVDPVRHSAAVSEYALSNAGFGQLAVVHGARVRTQTVGGTPGAVAVDTSDGAACVVNRFSGSVSIAQGSAVQTVPTGVNPIAAATDDGAGLCYVANFHDSTVTEVPMP